MFLTIRLKIIINDHKVGKMKVIKVSCAILLTALLLSGCGGGDSTGPTAIFEIGSSSLLVTANIDGLDQGGGIFTTNYIVSVFDSLGTPVNDAIITISRSQLGTITLALDIANPGTYIVSQSGYSFGTYTLNVSRGTDFIANASVFAPDIHTILYPTTSDTLRQDAAFTVLWNRQYKADLVEIETRDFGPVLATDVGFPDIGSYIIPASFNPRTNQRVRIKRSNSVTLISGLAGSSFTAEIRNTAEPIIVI